MRQKKGFTLRDICGEKIIVAEGIENIDFSSIISMNESAAFLWQQLKGKPFTTDDMTRLLLDEYEVDEATARQDAEKLAEDWLKAGIISQD